MNLFQLASRGIDLDALPDESAPEREPLAFEPSPAGSRFAVPQEFDAAFQAAGDEYGVDPDVLRAMAFAESRFRPDVISGQVKSRTGAAGLMQFMPGTAERFGINPLDPVESIFGAAAYMRANLEKFDGDYGKAVAAYNWGENRKAYDAEDWQALAPKETQGYLKTVFGAADELKLRAPAPVPPVKPPPKDAAAPEAAKAQPGAIPERTWGEAFGDTTKSLAQGLLDVGSLPGVAYSAVTGDWDTGYLKAIRGTQDVLQDQKSSEIQARGKAVQDKLSTAEGWREKLAVGGIETLKDPTLLFDTLARSAPGMFAGGVVGRGAGAAANAVGNAAFAKALGTGSELAARVAVTAKNGAGVLARATATGTAAGIQGASVASETYEELSKLPVEAFKSEPEWKDLEAQHGAQQAKEILAGAAANRALLMATGASVLSMKLVPGGDAIEKMFLPPSLKGAAAKAAVASTSLLTRPMGKGMEGGLVSKAVELIVKGSQAGALESVSEGVEEGTGAIAKGLELSRAGQRVNLSEMAGEAYGQGAAAGLVMGKVAGMQEAYGSRAPRVEDQPTTPQAPIVPSAPVAPQAPQSAQTDVAAQILQAEAAQPQATGLAAELEVLRARSAPAPDFTQRSTTPQAQPGSVPVTGGLAAELQALRARSSPQEAANAPQRTPSDTQQQTKATSAQAADVAGVNAPVPSSNIPGAVVAATQATGVDISTTQGATANVPQPAQPGTQAAPAASQKTQAIDKAPGAASRALIHLAGLKGARLIADDGRGRKLIEVNVTPEFRRKHFVNGRMPMVDGLELKEKSVVTGNVHDNGYVLIDNREQLAARRGASLAPGAQGEAQAAQAGVAPRPKNWRTSMLGATPVAKAMGIDTKGKRLAQVVAEIDARDTQAPATPAPAPTPGPARLGRDNTPLSEGGKPFKTRKAAGDAKKLQPMMRVVTVPGGYALAEKTPAQLAAEERAAKRLRTPRTSPAGEPVPAHAFIAASGGLHMRHRNDLGVDGNPRIGNRRLFGGLNRGLSIEQATEMLVADGYLSEGASHNDAYALIKKSLSQPQYNADGIERIAQAESDAQFEDYMAAQEEAAAEGDMDPFDMAGEFTSEELDDVGYASASPALQAEVNALIAQADAMDIDTYAILEDIARTYANATQDQYNAAARDALTQAIARSNQDGGSVAAQAAPAAEPAAAQGLNRPSALTSQAQAATENVAPTNAQEGIAAAQAKAARFAIGKSLTKEQRKQVLESLVDTYKTKGAEREFKGLDSNGNDRYGYVYSPELFEKSDITGAMVRYYVTLPDGRIAHPTELFQDVSASDVERMALEQESKKKAQEAYENAIKPFYPDFDSANLMATTGQVVISKGDRLAIIPDRTGAVGQARQQGWEVAKQAQTATENVAQTVSTTVEMPPTRQQESSPFARFATGRYRIAIRDEGNGQYAEVVAIQRGSGVEIEMRMPGEALEHPAFSQLNARAQALFETPTASMFDAEPPSLELAAQTPAEAAARRDAQEQADKAEAAAKRAEDAAAKAEEDRKRIAQASVRAADRFELGQDPMDSLTGQGAMFSRTGAQSSNAQQPTSRAWYDRFVSLLPASYRNDPHRREPLPAEDWNVQRASEVRSKVEALNKQLRGADDRKGYGPVSVDGLGNLQVDARDVSAEDLAGDIMALANELGAGIAATNVRSADARALQNSGFVSESSLAAIADRLMQRPFASPTNNYAKDSAPGTVMTYKPRGFPAALFARDVVQNNATPARPTDSNARNVATQMLVDGLTEKWTRAPEIIVARNMQDTQIPQAVRDYDQTLKSQGATGEARGFIYKGKVYLLSDELKGPQQIAEVLFHEVLGHYGLRGAFGESLTPILQQIGTMRRRDVVAKAREYGLFDKDALGGMDKKTASVAQIWAAMSSKDRLSAAEEVLAEMAQTQPNIGFVQRAIAAIRNWLRANVPGFKSLRLTDADIIQAYILPASGFVTRSKETGAQSLERAMMAFSRVWHGSPHKFLQFDSSKIGTGEGAQAYGHGLYLAESPDVAKSYQTALSADRGFSFGGKDGLTRAEVQDLVNAKYGGGYLDGVIRPSGVADSFIDDMVTGTLRPDGAMPRQYKPGSDRARVYNELRGQLTHTDPGALYQVDLPDEYIAKMLDWDKPLSEQPPEVQKALASIANGKMTGEQAWKAAIRESGNPLSSIAKKTGQIFSTPQEAADNLQRLGIPGIRYLDGGSRGNGAGTSNYVIFPGMEKILTILDVNGEPVTGAEKAKVLGEQMDLAFSRTATDQTQTENFRRWFAGSKVVDADGKPMVVYHGTHSSFTEFKPNDALGGGMFFSPSPEEAGAFTGATGSNIMPVYLSAQKVWPKIVRSYDEVKAIRAAKSKGYDAIRVRDDQNGVVNWVVFDPTQVKSATGNNGDFDPANPDIRFSRTQTPIPASAQASLFATPPWQLPEATRTDKLIYELQDGRIDLKRVQEAIAATGKQITEGFDARLAETLMPGRIARRTESFLSAEVKPLLESMAKNNVSQDELSDYLLARHAPERNAQIAKVNDEMPDGGAGTNSQGVLMTTQAARDHIAALTQGKRLVLELLAKRVDDLTLGTREVLVREGLEKQETVDAWTGAYKHYVPLFKDEAMETPGHPIGAGVSVTGTASRRATGSTGEVTNMLAHILMQREAAITRAEKNRVAMSLYGLALTNPNAEMWTTIRPSMPSDQIANELVRMGVDPMEAEVGMQGVPTIRGVDPVSGKVVDRPNPMYKRLDNSLVVKVNGEDRVILFNASNKRAVRLVRNLKNQDGVLGQLDLAGSIVGKATRYFVSINTQYNPAFGMVNIVRDVGGAMVNLTDTALAGKQARVLSDSIPAMIGIARDLRGDAQRTPWSDLWQQFQDDGGRTGYRDLFIDPYKRADAVQSELDKLGKDGKLTPGAAAHAVLDLLDDFNTTLENGVRLSAYKAALDKGMSRAESARLARELTLDFNRKGRAGREIGPLFAFFNASVQGTARTLKALQGPAGKRILIGGLSLGVIQALLLSMAGYEDDEIPEFVKARAFIIPLAGKQYITIPLQFGLNALPNTGRVVTELLMSGGKDWGEKSFNALGELAGSFNPLGGGNIFTGAGALKTISPTVIDPIVDMATNTDFTGKPIGKERMPWDTRPGFTMGREGTQRSFTGQSYIGISKAINSLTGGNDFAQGLASPSPEEVRYVFTTVGGGVYRELEKILNASVLTAQGEDLKAREVPLGSRFAGEVDDQDLQRSRFFKNSSKIEKLEAQLKGLSKEGRGDEVRKLIDDSPLVKLNELNDEVRSNVTKLNKLASESINDKEALKRIDAARTTYMRALNDKVLEMEKAGDKAASVPVWRSPDVDDDATGEPSLEAESN